MTDINDRLRRLGARLDADAPPIVASEVRDRPARRPERRRWLAPAAVAASVALLVGAAGLVFAVTRDDGRANLVTTPAAPSTSAMSSPVSTTAPTTSTSTTTTSTTATTSTSSATTEAGGGLPGARQDIPPSEGARLAVVGVRAGDILNVRAGPGADYPVVHTLGPLSEEATSTGHNRLIPGRGSWSEIRVGQVVGWVNAAFVLQPGRVDDVTSQMYPAGAERPSGSLAQLAAAVAAQAVQDDEIEPRVVVVDGPRAGDLGEIAVDVLGIGDDSVGGFRLRIFAAPTGRGDYTVRTVEQLLLCSRAVSDGLCV